MSKKFIHKVNRKLQNYKILPGIISAPLLFGVLAVDAVATEPCGDFGECKALIEINSSDGDIGFHFLMDGNDLNAARIRDPNGKMIFNERARGPLREQKLTETFVESAEPPCWWEEGEDWDEDEVVNLEDFLGRWSEGTYRYKGWGDDGERSRGRTDLTYELPAAPADLAFDGSIITWGSGDDLGECAEIEDLDDLVSDGVLPVHPEDVEVAVWEVVLEPDVDDGDPLGKLKLTIRVAGDIATKAVTVPTEYLAHLPDDTPAKIEVGAIGVDDNATFTELAEICLNVNEGCGDED